MSQLTPRPEDVAIGLSELLVNAVEHGNLTFDYDETSTLLEERRWNDAVPTSCNNPIIATGSFA